MNKKLKNGIMWSLFFLLSLFSGFTVLGVVTWFLN